MALVAIMNLSIPYRSISPGPAYDVGQLLSLEGAETFGSSGSFFLTTVSLRSVRVADAIRGWIDPVVDVVEVERIVPRGVSDEEADRIQQQQMEQSQLSAAAAALSLLGHDVSRATGGVRVQDVLESAPAASVLQPGDLIVGAAGRPLCDPQALVSAVNTVGIGAEIPLRVRRDMAELEVTVETIPRPDSPGEPMIGVEIQAVPGSVELPVKVTIDSRGVGGPSAGLMFALAIVERLRSDDLTSGRAIAGTGVISCGGLVGPVGGVHQKVVAAERAGASVFLAPASELRDACRVADEIEVIGVATLEDAVRALQDAKVAASMSCP